MTPELDLGHGVTASYTSHAGHCRAGLIEWHPCAARSCRNRRTGTPGRCGGSILFDLPGIRAAFPDRAVWQVESFDPLTLSPSVWCACPGCTHHGYIRAGRWEPV